MFSTAVENVVVTKFPPRQIYSGQVFSLVCTVMVSPSSSSDLIQIHWYNGTTELVDSHMTHITGPVMQSESTYYSVLEVRLALTQTSWYTCGATAGEESPHYDNIHITVENTGKRYMPQYVYTFSCYQYKCVIFYCRTPDISDYAVS